MTRFDAETPTERTALFAEAIVAHRERASPYLTIEVDVDSLDDAERAVGGVDSADRIDVDVDGGDANGAAETNGPDPALGVPWVQCSDDLVNLDCTDAELDRCTSLLAEYPAFRIDELTRPEDAPGVNVRVRARTDPDRIAQFIDAIFRRVYELPPAYRAWVVEI